MRLQPKLLGSSIDIPPLRLSFLRKGSKEYPNPLPPPQPPTTTDQGHLVYLSSITGPSGAPEASYLVSTPRHEARVLHQP